MAKRENNYSRTDARADFKSPQNIEDSLNYLERVGKLKSKMVLPPKYISERCTAYYYNTI